MLAKVETNQPVTMGTLQWSEYLGKYNECSGYVYRK